ncbi:hypothetical protein EAO70_20770 [Streptomyces sp. adm13(2018)]|uniref:hypothetical protein n=1 Tax=Streptomyces sp. adm13(2018) TaxID=2479007 RepID=UPI0011CE42FF|nr:hypothetical protein [Streptomyces sp. adm13(2018)]TXS14018.1 hypothetical protein EAO70_20770 [Streptomyces sp. adm13(2018)]
MTGNRIEQLDVPLADLEQQIAEIRAHFLAANPQPDGDHWDQCHAFLDIDPDLRGRDYGRPS